MLKSIFHLLLSSTLFISSIAMGNDPIMKLRDLQVYADDTDTYRYVSKGETVTLKRITTNRVMINGMEIRWSDKDSYKSLKRKMSAAYEKSKKKSAFLETLLFSEAEAAIPLWFGAIVGGMLGFAGGRATCASNGSRTTASEEKEKN